MMKPKPKKQYGYEFPTVGNAFISSHCFTVIKISLRFALIISSRRKKDLTESRVEPKMI
jgi:hypothetical protein